MVVGEEEKTVEFAAQDDVVACELDGGSALLDLNSSQYYKLNATGSFVWENLTKAPISGDQIAEKLTSQFDVAKDVCLPDVMQILQAFEAAGLITRQTA